MSDTPTSVDPRTTCPIGCEDAGPLCLLRHIGQHSTIKLVRLSGSQDLAEVAVAAREPIPMGSVYRPLKAAPPTGTSDRPSLHRCERSSPVRNRKLEICTSGSVRGEDGNIGAASKAADLGGERPLPSIARFGRLATSDARVGNEPRSARMKMPRPPWQPHWLPAVGTTWVAANSEA